MTFNDEKNEQSQTREHVRQDSGALGRSSTAATERSNGDGGVGSVKYTMASNMSRLHTARTRATVEQEALQLAAKCLEENDVEKEGNYFSRGSWLAWNKALDRPYSDLPDPIFTDDEQYWLAKECSKSLWANLHAMTRSMVLTVGTCCLHARLICRLPTKYQYSCLRNVSSSTRHGPICRQWRASVRLAISVMINQSF